jgi:hypothetical protein
MHSLIAKTDESYLDFLHSKTSQFCRFIAVKISLRPHLTASKSGVLKMMTGKDYRFVIGLRCEINVKNCKIEVNPQSLI